MFDSLKMMDRSLFLKINSLHTPFLDVLMWHLSASWHTYLFVAVVAFVIYRKFTKRKAAEFLLGCAIVVACTDLSTNLIKHQVKRYRPSHNLEIQSQVHIVNGYKGGQYSFFSSHTANGFGVTTFVFFCLSWLRKRGKFLLFFYPLAIGYSRIYLGVHYPSEVFVGILDGLFFATLVYYLMNKYFFSSNVRKA